MKYSIRYLLLLISVCNLQAQNITRQATWQQRTDYEINVKLNPEDKTLDAFVSIHYFNNSPDTLKSIWLHVWPNAYKNIETAYALQEIKNGHTDFQFSPEKDKGNITGFHFKAEGDTLKWHFDTNHIDIIQVILNQPLLPQSELTFNTPFKVKLPRIFSRGGNDADFYAITQWFPKPAVYDINGWNTMPYLNQGEFYSEFGDFNVNIYVPEKFMVASTGNKISERDTSLNNSVKYKHYLFCEKNIHDFAWFASPDFLIQRRAISIGKDDTVQLNYFEYSKDLKSLSSKKANSNLTWPIERAIIEYSKRVGNYPYKNCTVVIGKLIAGGGMEYPTITVCSSADEETIIHEVGHNWFYGMLGTNERRYPWMDESINTFYEQKISGRMVGDSLYYTNFKGINWLKNYGTLTGYLFSARQGLSQPLNLSSEEFSNLNYGSIVYCKGPLLFAYLEQQLGDSLFQKCMRNYFKAWQYKHPLPQDMQNSFEQTCGMNLDWFFKDLLNENNQTDIVKTKSGIRVAGSESLDSFLIANKVKEPNRFGFLPETNYLNNGQKLKLLTIGIPLHLPRQNARAEVNLSPAGGYNLYDKFYLGAVLFNRTLFRKKFEYILMPSYAFGSEKIVGYGRINMMILSKNKIIYKTETGIQGQSFGMQLYSYNNQYTRLNPYILINFKHNGIIDDRYDHELKLNVYHTGLEKTYKTINDTTTLNFPSSYFYNYCKLTWKFEDKHPVHHYSIILNTEYGANYKYQPGNDKYIKSWINASYSYQYAKKKYFKTSFFGGFFIMKKGNISNQKFYLSGNTGYTDYQYNETMLGRSENIFSNNILGHQIISNNGNMRNVIFFISRPENWLLSSSNEVSLPGIIPFRLYFDMGFYPYKEFQKTAPKPELIYTAGITISLFNETLEIFFPLYQSKQFKAFNQYNYAFSNSIGFKLNINKLEPTKLIDNYRP